MLIFRTQQRATHQITNLNRGTDGHFLRLLPAVALFLVCAATAQAQMPEFSFTLTTTANPVQVGQAVDLVAVVVGGGAGSTDTMTFTDGFGTIFGGTNLCTNVAVSVIASEEIAHCVVAFAEAGHHYVSATLTAGPPGVVIPLSNEIREVVTAPVSFDANQFALTGAWYNPATSGQGLELQVYPDWNGSGNGLLFGGWFTYDSAGHPQWVTVQGNLSASHGASYHLGIYRSSGGNFAALPVTTAVADGTATLTFYDCTDAALSYSFTDGRSGTIPYVRLSNPTGCSSAAPAIAPMPLPANYNDVLHSGAWYDPAMSGQGLSVDIIPSQTTLFASWYTYAPLSEGLTGSAAQRWFTLQTNDYTPGNLALHDVPIYASAGGIFNQPSAVTTGPVGTANITFTSCTTMTLDYTFTAGEFNGLTGSIDEQNLRAPSGCQ